MWIRGLKAPSAPVRTDKLATCRCDCVTPYAFRLKPDATLIFDTYPHFYPSDRSFLSDVKSP